MENQDMLWRIKMLFHLNNEYMSFGEAMVYLMNTKHMNSTTAFEFLESIKK